MSSDYIPRLRQELLRAGAGQESAWRRARLGRMLRPLAPVAVAALAAVALVVAWPADDPAVEPAGNVATLSYRVLPPGAAAAKETAEVMRARLAAADVDGAQVTATSDATLTITAPPAAQADVEALTRRGQLAFYDWQASLRGPAEGTSRAEAEARGGRVVRAEGAAERWVVLAGRPALTDVHVESASAGLDEARNEPLVALEFTPAGQEAFSALTRELAHRGSARAEEEEDLPDIEAAQNFAIVVDDRILAVPFIGFWAVPDGLDGADGGYIPSRLPEDARRLAAILDTGPLPAELVPSGAGGDEELPRG